MSAFEESYELPGAAARSLAEPGLRFELHCISFSHYCLKAQWALRLAGIPFSEVGYLPLAHVPGIIRLQKRFSQGPGQPTASSKSPAATPVLAIYSQEGQPICLLQNSNLISRYAALRAKALGLPAADLLYGSSITAAAAAAATTTEEAPCADSRSAGSAAGGGPAPLIVVSGSDALYQSVSQLELRLSGVMGIEVRRVLYHYLLPNASLGGPLFARNSSGLQHILAWPVYFICRLLLPKLLKVNAATVAKGKEMLLQEFDFFDQLLHLQQQAVSKPGSAAAAGGAGGSSNSSSDVKLPYYLCGEQMTAADVTLACLAGYMVGVPAEHLGKVYSPGIQDMPKEIAAVMEGLRDRPTGKFVLDMWRVHGPHVSLQAAEAVSSSSGQQQ